MATKGNNGGRPTKLTSQIQNRIVALLEEDNYRETAADKGGIARSTFYNWMKRGEKEGDGIYHEFSKAVLKAEAKAEVDDIAHIRAGNENWQARAWIRERKNPDRWGKKERQDIRISDAEGKPLVARVEIVNSNDNGTFKQIN